MTQFIMISNYEEAAMRTAKDMGSVKMNLIHAALGLTSDAGEFATAIKASEIYNKPLDFENAIEELGDCLWFIALACKTLGTNMGEVMGANIEKLAKRYPDKYSDEAAIARADKSEHVSDCSSNNAGVPKLLGECDCKKEEQTSTQKSNMQKIMDSLGDTVYFVSPSQMDANNFKYSFGPFQSESSVVKFTEGKRIVTVVKKSDHINWSNWYIKAGWVPA